MLVLFVFINSLAGGAAIIESRRLGMYERMSAAPVAARSIVAGETLCYLAMALLQSLLIVAVGALVFGVDWGDPLAATALVASWALVGTGTGVLTGTLFRTAEQASAIGPPLGIAFGMLGGCMWPLEIVPAPMRALGHVVPHGWAIDAWTVLLSRGGSVLDIAGELGVLLGFAAVLLLLATTRLRRAIAA
jgi:ABC-2 type transport system permease protein